MLRQYRSLVKELLPLKGLLTPTFGPNFSIGSKFTLRTAHPGASLICVTSLVECCEAQPQALCISEAKHQQQQTFSKVACCLDLSWYLCYYVSSIISAVNSGRVMYSRALSCCKHTGALFQYRGHACDVTGRQFLHISAYFHICAAILRGNE